MSQAETPYDSLDRAVIEHIKNKEKGHPRENPAVRKASNDALIATDRADDVDSDEVIWHLVNRRLQAMRKSGLIRFDRPEKGAPKAWIMKSVLCDDPPSQVIEKANEARERPAEEAANLRWEEDCEKARRVRDLIARRVGRSNEREPAASPISFDLDSQEGRFRMREYLDEVEARRIFQCDLTYRKLRSSEWR